MNLARTKSIGQIVIGLAFFWQMMSPASAADTRNSHQIPRIVLSSEEVTNGSLLLVQIDSQKLNPPIIALQITFLERTYPLHPHPVNPTASHFGLISIPFRSPPGPAELKLTWTTAAGRSARTIRFKIVAGNYKTDLLKVDPARVNPNKKNLQRARKEAAKLKRIYAAGNITRLWENDYQLPITSKITSFYGNKRVYNGQLKSYHNGIDFRAPIGTPVFAPNSGVVKLAENLFYSGNVVIIDHGTTVFTIYAHMSKIKVEIGQQIEKGHLIGLTGATGRVSGPHLHWGVKVKGVAVDPMQFVQIMTSLLKEQG